MTHLINNFVDGSPLEIKGYSHPDGACGALVCITQNSGSMSLRHAMRPAQARELAAALIHEAAEAERLEAERDRDSEVAA